MTLIYKGAGSRSDPASYRPITLLNADVKLLGKALSDRWLPRANKVINTTQTAFLPNRWIGDNVLAHLETVEYNESRDVPGVIAFLDFSKAYDRLDRGWLLRSMQAVGFGPQARQWASILHTGLSATVRYNNGLVRSSPSTMGLLKVAPCPPYCTS